MAGAAVDWWRGEFGAGRGGEVCGSVPTAGGVDGGWRQQKVEKKANLLRVS
jgi:hypothetical protein